MLHYIGISQRFRKYSTAHTHECCEVILNIKGEGTITIGEEKLPFFPGSVHIVPKNTPHIKEASIKFQDIFLLTDDISFVQKSPFAFQDDEAKTLEKLLQIMLCRYPRETQGDSILQSMYELVLKIIAEACTVEKSDTDVDAIISKLALSFNDPELSLSKILEGVGYCKDHVRRKFLAQTGMTPVEYITSLRIEHAKKLLSKQNALSLQIGDISMLCGYYDQRYFCRIFKRETGMTPTEYLKSTASQNKK